MVEDSVVYTKSSGNLSTLSEFIFSINLSCNIRAFSILASIRSK